MSGLEFCKYNIFVSKSDKSIEDRTSILCLIVSLILFILRFRNKHIHTLPHVCAWRRWLGRGSECLVVGPLYWLWPCECGGVWLVWRVWVLVLAECGSMWQNAPTSPHSRTHTTPASRAPQPRYTATTSHPALAICSGAGNEASRSFSARV